jgi:hypothetical protein
VLNEELTPTVIQEIFEGLTTSFLNISEKEYAARTLNQIKYDVDYSFSKCNQGPPIKKFFRKVSEFSFSSHLNSIC